jgi:hypothetical protein
MFLTFLIYYTCSPIICHSSAGTYLPKAYAPGTKVTGRFGNGLRYPGVVQSYDPSCKTYDILFDDWDRHRNFRAIDVVRL